MRLKVGVLAARNLPDIETFGKVDPFFVVAVNGECVFTSTVVPDSTAPTWNEHTDLTIQSDDKVVVTLLNENLGEDDAFGHFEIDVAALSRGANRFWANLTSDRYKADAEFSIIAVDFGSSNSDLPPAETRELRVQLLAVTNLPDTDTFGASDCYVVLTWCGSKFKSSTQHDTASPDWNAQEEGATATLKGDPREKLEVEAWDEDPGGDEIVGSGELSLGTLRQGETKNVHVKLSHPSGFAPVARLRLTALDFGSTPKAPAAPASVDHVQIEAHSVSCPRASDGVVTLTAHCGRRTWDLASGQLNGGDAALKPNSVRLPRIASLRVAFPADRQTVALKSLTENLVRGIPIQKSVALHGGGRITLTLTAVDFGPDHKTRDPVDLVYDRAFQKACENCGVTPSDLKPKTLSDFQQNATSDDAALHQFQVHQNTLVKRLHNVVLERQRLLAEARRQEVSAQEQQGSGSDDAQDGLMVERAKRQRAVWDTNNQRLETARRLREQALAEAEIRAAERAEAERKRQEENHAQMLALHRANQEQMKKRFARDEELATLRQQQIDKESERRLQAWGQHQDAVRAARTRRNEQLKKWAGSGSDANTQARLEKAKELRQRVDEEIADRTKQTLALVDQKRERHAMKQFLRQVELANKALTEREDIELHLQRTSEQLDAHLSKAAARIDEENARYNARMAETSASRQAAVAELGNSRELRHERAKSARIQASQHRFETRRQQEERRAHAEAERQERLRQEEERKRDAAKAREAHQREVMLRVNKQAQDQQKQRAERLEQQQRAAEARMEHLAEIRAMLK